MNKIFLILLATCIISDAAYQSIIERKDDGKGGHTYTVVTNKGVNGALITDVISDPLKVAELDKAFGSSVYGTAKSIGRIIIYTKDDGTTDKVDAHHLTLHESIRKDYSSLPDATKTAIATTKDDLQIPDKKEVAKESQPLTVE